jgi:hypothetical protein
MVNGRVGERGKREGKPSAEDLTATSPLSGQESIAQGESTSLGWRTRKCESPGGRKRAHGTPLWVRSISPAGAGSFAQGDPRLADYSPWALSSRPFAQAQAPFTGEPHLGLC